MRVACLSAILSASRIACPFCRPFCLIARTRYLAANEALELSACVSGLLGPMIEKEFKRVGRELMVESEET
jgi:hypothetical protein